MRVIVIGGGAAGIGAAYKLLRCPHRFKSSNDHRGKRSRLEVVLVEARLIYGGRASTSNDLQGFAFDKGAQYIQDPNCNTWTTIAEDVLELKTIEEDDLFGGGYVATDKQKVDGDLVQSIVNKIESSFGSNWPNPNQTVTGDPGMLKTNEEVIAYATSPYGPIQEAVETWQYIASDRHRQTDADDGGNNLFVKAGIGTMVQSYGERLKALGNGRFVERLGEKASKIVWDETNVRVETNLRWIDGDYCIVTVPIPILQTGAITFDPPLPEAYSEAFNLVRLGSYKKFAFRLAECSDETIQPGEYYYMANPPGTAVWQYFRLKHYPNFLVVVAFGDWARQLDKLSDVAALALCREAILDFYGEAIAFVEGGLTTNWTNDEFAQGAYSYTAPDAREGEAGTTAFKARPQIRKRMSSLAFAGEATHVDQYGTIAGALYEGRAAASDCIAELKRRV